MKKKTLLLVLCLLVFVASLLMSVVAYASTATVTTRGEFYKGEYGDLFADRGEDKDHLQSIYGNKAVILFGEVQNLPENAEYGIVRYPKGEDYTSENAVYMPGKAHDENGKFGVAVSLGGEFLNSGEWSQRAYLYTGETKDEDQSFTAQDIQYMTFGEEYDFSANDTVVITTAEEFMNISSYEPGTQFELGADIDLTSQTWTQTATYSYKYLGNNTQINITNMSYLVPFLPQTAVIDGRGHKITAVFDESEYTLKGGPAVIFGRIPAITGGKSFIKNLIVDFTVKGDAMPTEGFGGLAFHADSVAVSDSYFNLKSIYNSGDPKRMSVFARVSNNCDFSNCILMAEAKVGSSSIATGNFYWTNYGNNTALASTITNSTIIAKGKDYDTLSAFYDDWTANLVANQNTYTAWNFVETKTSSDLTLFDRSVASVEADLDTIRIFSAEDFMQIGSLEKGKKVALYSDIDLTQESWTYEESFVHAWTNQNGTPASSTLSKITYLVRDLYASIDGRGHKITVNYDQANVTTHGLPAIIGATHKDVTIQNLVVDFTMTATASARADFYGALAINADGTTIKNCFIKGRFNFASGAVYNDLKRASVIGRSTNYTVIENCIADMQVTVGGVNQNAGNYWWTNNGSLGKLTNSTIINPVTMDTTSVGKTGVSYYSSLANFISAWGENTVTNQTTYTAWSVANGKILLKGKEVA